MLYKIALMAYKFRFILVVRICLFYDCQSLRSIIVLHLLAPFLSIKFSIAYGLCHMLRLYILRAV